MPSPTDDTLFPLAAIVFDREQDPDSPLRAFVAAQSARGVSVGGLLQEHAQGEGCSLHDVSVYNVATGERLDVMQDLGVGATGCRVDPAAIAVAARQLGDAVAARPQLIVANRFGRLESEGGGMIAEIGEAVAEGVPLIVCVPLRFLGAWNGFAGGLGAQLPPRREAIEAWWAMIAPIRASAA
jgi:hypothetical protein